MKFVGGADLTCFRRLPLVLCRLLPSCRMNLKIRLWCARVYVVGVTFFSQHCARAHQIHICSKRCGLACVASMQTSFALVVFWGM